VTDNLGSNYGMAGPSSTMGVAQRPVEQVRRAQVVAADIICDLESGEDEKLAGIREVMQMLGLKYETGLEKY